MKTALRAFGVSVVLLNIYICVCAGPETISRDNDFDKCVYDLGLKKMDLYELTHKPAFPCLLACLQEKAGVMASGKIQFDKYVQNYMESQKDNSNDIYLIHAKLIDCATKANELSDKCMVADYTRKCEAEYQEVLFP